MLNHQIYVFECSKSALSLGPLFCFLGLCSANEGRSVSISGDAALIAVGQYNNEDDGCWIFRFNGFGYEPLQKVVTTDGKGTVQGQSGLACMKKFLKPGYPSLLKML